MQKLLQATTADDRDRAIIKELLGCAEVMADALRSARSVIKNEIIGCELSGRQTNAFPDLLTGCVSGGGIEAALAAFDAFKATYTQGQ